MGELRRVRPKSRKAWRNWLEKNHASSSGVWLVYAKKHSGLTSLTYSDAVEEALCFGWIDSKINPIDDAFYMQVFTPRKPKSAWSALNKARVERLLGAGLMTPAGLVVVKAAKDSMMHYRGVRATVALTDLASDRRRDVVEERFAVALNRLRRRTPPRRPHS